MNGIWFFDNWMLERADCLERVWGKPTFVKEIFTEFKPLGSEGYGGYITVFHDRRLGCYVMYLFTHKGRVVFRLQSDNPYDWPNPSYDPAAALGWKGASNQGWKGFKDVVVDQNGQPIWAYAVHSLAGTPLAERGYVTTVLGWPRHVTLGGFSDDGLQFAVDAERPWLDPGSDTAGDILWNEQAGLFQLFVRPVYTDRRVAISVTEDFQEFSRPTTVLQPDSLDRLGAEFYDMPARPYEGMFIGLLHVFSTDRFEEVSDVSPRWPHLKYFGRIETELTYSYNGSYWYRTARDAPFMPIRPYGLQGGGAVYGMEMLRTTEDKLLFYAQATKGGHADFLEMQEAGLDYSGDSNPLLYEMRLDGFCSLKTWGRDGVMRTKVLIPKDGEISLNVRTMAHSHIRVQMLDGVTAQPIAGYTWDEALPVSGDHLYARPRWQERSDISELIDRPVRIEIAMREAELFAIRVKCEAFYACDPLPTLW